MWNTQVSILSHVYLSCKPGGGGGNCFLRLCLPVFLQQYLRCKVWDDTAKIKYIALFAISEQCSNEWRKNSLWQQSSVSQISIPNYSEALPLLAFHMLIWDITVGGAPVPKHVAAVNIRSQIDNGTLRVKSQNWRQTVEECSHGARVKPFAQKSNWH